MSMGGFTLGDRLGAKTVNCRVRGCKRTWLDWSSNPKLAGDGASAETRGLCDPCKKKLPELADQTMPCSRPTCTGTWTATREQQLEAFAAGRPVPKMLCADCETKLAGLSAKEAACVVPGCTRTATLSPRQQLLGDGNDQHGVLTLTGPMCAPCTEVAERIELRHVPCGIHQCKRSWTWTPDDQIVAFAAGKPSTPPRRMCSECRANFGKLADREVRCRASGCKNHFIWTRDEQLDAAVADKPLGKPPAHLCERCFKLWNELADVERPCRQAGCHKTWTDNRGAQLARAIRGKTGDPYPQYCEEHSKLVDDLEDRAIKCKTDGCDHTWTWTRNQQLAAGVRPEVREEIRQEAGPGNDNGETAGANAAPDGAARATDATALPAAPATIAETAAAPSGDPPAEAATTPAEPPPAKKKAKRRREIRPPGRHCQRCADFLGGHKTIELPCGQCGTPIFWPPESQLQTELGHWEIPKLCGACKRDATEAARKKAREDLRQQIVTASAAAKAHATSDGEGGAE